MLYPMTKQEYRRVLKDYELTQARAAWLFNGKSDRSGRRWATEGAPYHVALIVELMREFQLTPEDIETLGRKYHRRIETMKEEAA
jgi:hypothetical protein